MITGYDHILFLIGVIFFLTRFSDITKFDKDMKDPALEARIDKETNQMRQSGIPRLSVPKFLINGKEPQGGRTIENYSAIIDAELKKK